MGASREDVEVGYLGGGIVVGGLGRVGVGGFEGVGLMSLGTW